LKIDLKIECHMTDNNIAQPIRQSNEFYPKNAETRRYKCNHHHYQIRKVAAALRPQGREFQGGSGE